jgi:tRNA dimethylallyltransferase
MRASPPILVLVGPTASGKTALLDAIFGSRAAREAYGLPEAEVISADSMQAYRGLDIGTAKPDAGLLARLPHRLLDIRDIDEQYSAGDFARLADLACAEIAAAGKLAVVSGGTGYYVRNFICGLPAAPAADPRIREEVTRDLAERGPGALRAELAALDPESAARIHAKDLYRLTRALEIIRATGRPLAEFAAPTGPRPGLRLAVVGVSRPREELAARIDARVDAMMEAGLAEEVAALRRGGRGAGDPGMQAIGYREFLAAGGGVGESSPAEIAEAIKRDTRRYAKRQMTFFRGLPGIEWISPDPEALAALVRGRLGVIAPPPPPGL